MSGIWLGEKEWFQQGKDDFKQNLLQLNAVETCASFCRGFSDQKLPEGRNFFMCSLGIDN